MEGSTTFSPIDGTLRVARLTDIGNVRSHNEDALGVFPERGLLIVSDGMGGMNAGDVAARLVVEVLPEMLEEALGSKPSPVTDGHAEAVKDAVARLNREIAKLSDEQPEVAGMGATVVLALIRGSHAFIAHVGDSRAYLYRDGRLTQLTEDHSVSEVVFGRGELTRFIGMRGAVCPDVRKLDLRSGDKLVLCTDGLTSEIKDREIERIVRESDGLEQTCRSLVRAAGEAGGRDNITAIVAEWLEKGDTPAQASESCPLCGEPYPPAQPGSTGRAVRCRTCGEESLVKSVVDPTVTVRASTGTGAEPEPLPTVLRKTEVNERSAGTTSAHPQERYRGPDSRAITTSIDVQRTRTPYVAMTLSRAELHEAEADVAIDWKPGDVILDLYEITETLGEGGMGLVYKARHRGWNMDLAVKTPKPEIVAAVGGAEDFAGEAETWVNLGLHPHVVNCYYVRTLGGIPRIFVEYLEGGTLWDWVRSRKLYAGGRDEALSRIIDLAVQAAWGLDCAHKQGLIHQDMKPANVMMDLTGRAKVTDFGLARARSQAGRVMVAAEEGKTVIVAGGGMFTPAYASPEQIHGKPLTAATDLWSWAATVVEMFAGGLYWSSGHLVGEFLVSFLDNWSEEEVAPCPPDNIVRLLKRCFAKDPEARPSTVAEVVAVLVEEFGRVTGKPYQRPAPTMGPATGESLNNRGASMLDLGNRETALSLWDEALTLQPYHAKVTYNRGLILWRAGSWDETRLVKEMEEVLESAPGNWMPHYLLGMIHMERGGYQEAARILEAIPETESFYDQARTTLERARECAPRSRRLIRTLAGHSDSVLSVCFSPDGRHVLSGSEDASVNLWEVESGRSNRIYTGHTGPVVSVGFGPHGSSSFFSGSKDGTMKLWDTASGKCLSTIGPYRPDPVNAACLTSDGRYALRAGENEGGISVWDIRRAEYVGLLGSGGAPRSKTFGLVQSRLLRRWQEPSLLARYSVVCFSLDAHDKICLTASPSAVLTVWDMASRLPLRILEGHGDAVSSVFLSADGEYGLSGSADATIKLWHIKTGRCLRTFRGHSGAVSSVCMTRDRRCILSGGSDGTVRLWDAETGHRIRTFFGSTSPVTSVSVSVDGHVAVSGSRDGLVRLWAITSDVPGFQAPLMMSRVQTVEKALSTQMAYEQEIRSARRTLDDGDAVAAAHFLRRARSRKGYRRHPHALELWEQLYALLPKKGFAGGWKMDSKEGHSGPVNSVQVSHDCRFALSGSSDGTISFWDLTGATRSRAFVDQHKSPVTSVSIAPEGNYAISASEDKTVKLWDVSTGKAVRTFEGHLGPVLTADISHDGLYALSGSLDRTLRFWQVQTGKCLRILTHDLHLPVSVRFSRDGRHAVSGSWDKTIKLWKVASGQCVRTFGDDFHLPASVCLSYDGSYVLSGGTDLHNRHIRLWDVESRRLVRSFEGHTDLVHSVCLSSDDRYALSGSRDGTIKLWEIPTGRCLRTFVSHFGRVFSVSLSLDGKHAASAGDDMLVKLWTLDWALEDRRQTDWDEGASPYLVVFLNRHGPYAQELPAYSFWRRILSFVQSRGVKPAWTDKAFDDLIYTLGCAGFGWITREGVRRKLDEYASQWE